MAARAATRTACDACSTELQRLRVWYDARVIDIDGESFDPEIEHFAFSLYHRIANMDELAKLRSLTRLVSASFMATGLDDRGLSHVADVPTIENLNLQDTAITNDGLAHLRRLPRLQYLRLKDNPQLTNACIRHLLPLSALVDLGIHETSIDQRGVDRLTGLTSLRDLCIYVRDGNYRFDALLALSSRMPWCRILAKGRGEFYDGAFVGTW